jgi:hypothetical protein
MRFAKLISACVIVLRAGENGSAERTRGAVVSFLDRQVRCEVGQFFLHDWQSRL